MCSAAAATETAHCERAATELLSWDPRSASQPPAAGALTGVCEPRCFILIYFVPPLATRALRYQKGLRGYFLESGDTQNIFHLN